MLVSAGLPACAARDLPYRFRGPVVSAIRADELPPRVAPTPSRAAPQVAQVRAWLAPPSRAHAAAPPAPSPEAEPRSDDRERGRRDPVATLRAMAGARVSEAGPGFALGAVSELGAPVDARVRRVGSGASLLALAQDRGAVLGPDETPLTGDLVVLAADADADADLAVGVVVEAGARRVPVEIVHPDPGSGQVARALIGAGSSCHARAASLPCRGPERVRAYLRLDSLSE